MACLVVQGYYHKNGLWLNRCATNDNTNLKHLHNVYCMPSINSKWFRCFILLKDYSFIRINDTVKHPLHKKLGLGRVHNLLKFALPLYPAFRSRHSDTKTHSVLSLFFFFLREFSASKNLVLSFFPQTYSFLMEGKLLPNMVLASAIHQHESAVGTHVSPPSWSTLQPLTPSHPSRLLWVPRVIQQIPVGYLFYVW